MGGSLSSMYIASAAQVAAGLLGAGAFILVETKNFAAGKVTFSSLSGNYRYRLYLQATSDAAGGAEIHINADTNAGHYTRQYINCIGGVISGDRENSSNIANIPAAGGLMIVIDIARDNNGYICYCGYSCGPSTAAAIQYVQTSGAKMFATETAVTGIEIAGNGGITLTGTATLYKGVAV